MGFQYCDSAKLEDVKEKVKQEAEKEIIKLIGNKILDIERKWLNAENQYTYINYNNESRDLLDRMLALNKRNSSSWNWEDEI